MANKKRRKPSNRPRPQGAIRTAERADASEARPARGTRPEARTGNGASPRSAVRAERKELARRQREEVRKLIRRRQRMRQGAWILGAVVVVGAAFLWFTRPEPEAASTGQLPGLLRTETPWPANAEQALERADLINLPAHGTNLAMHEHVNLQVFVHGVAQQVPVDIGIAGPGDAASLHTHTGDGLVHIESSTVAEFTLKQIFDVWGVRYTPTCLGAYCDDATDELRVFVDGQPFAGTDITEVPLDPETVIVVTYGTEDELPSPIPASFDFSSIQA